jgi:hypothetical protein
MEEIHKDARATVSICLTPKAKTLRRQLAAWTIGLAIEEEDYVFNELGNRTYRAPKLEELVLLLLKEIGLEVSDKRAQTDVVLMPIGFGIYYEAIVYCPVDFN